MRDAHVITIGGLLQQMLGILRTINYVHSVLSIKPGVCPSCEEYSYGPSCPGCRPRSELN